MTRRPAPPLTAREAAVARAFDEAPVLPEAWDATAAVREPIEVLGDALQPWACCGAPNLCGVECQENELSDTLARAERLVRPHAEKARAARLRAAELNARAAS